MRKKPAAKSRRSSTARDRAAITREELRALGVAARQVRTLVACDALIATGTPGVFLKTRSFRAELARLTSARG